MQEDYYLEFPSTARMYDYWLGGKDNYSIDRQAADEVLEVYPEAPKLARQNRQFLIRAVQYCAAGGIDQFVDIGTGIPTSPNVGEVARSVHADARVVGVDNDPVVLAHDRALLEGSDGIRIVSGDIRQAREVMADPVLNETIDLARPVAVLAVAVLHFVRDEEDPAGIIASLLSPLAPGSFLVVSAATSTGTHPQAIERIREIYKGATSPVIFRPQEQILSWFDGLELGPPGLVDVSQWPELREVNDSTDVRIVAGVARKPGRT